MESEPSMHRLTAADDLTRSYKLVQSGDEELVRAAAARCLRLHGYGAHAPRQPQLEFGANEWAVWVESCDKTTDHY